MTDTAVAKESGETITSGVNSAATMLTALKAAAQWMRNGDYATRGGLIEMSRLAGILEAAIAKATVLRSPVVQASSNEKGVVSSSRSAQTPVGGLRAAPPAVFAFLLGEGPLEGRWFGDEPPKTATGHAKLYWWRTHLHAALPFSPSQPEPGSLRIALLEIAQACEGAVHCAAPTVLSDGHIYQLREIAAKARVALASQPGSGDWRPDPRTIEFAANTADEMEDFSASEIADAIRALASPPVQQGE